MKPTLFIIAALMLTVLPASVQAQRRLHGQRGLQATAGSVDGFNKNTLHAGIALSQFTKSGNRWVFGGEYLRKELPYGGILRVPVEQFTGEAGYYFTFLSDGGKNFFFSAGLSGMVGYESVNRGRNLLPDGSSILFRSKFLFGGAVSFEIEVYIVDRIILVAGFRERIMPGSDVNKFHSQLGLGIKCIIN
jgi:hypothetical protein